MSAHRPVVLGVAGGSGSGKTSVVREIVARFGQDHVTHLAHDAYYRDQSHLTADERRLINYDHPDSLETPLLAEHIRRLCDGESVNVPTYDFASHARGDATLTAYPHPVIIVEGILVLAEPELCDLMDIRVFVDTDPDIRLLRRLHRDIEKRGRSFESVVEQYATTVRPMHLEFVEPSKRNAHVIIPEGARNTVALDMLMTKIQSIVERDGV